MSNRNYINGVAWEREIIKQYEADGAIAFRSAGSHSFADVVAVYPGNRVVFIQCKVTKVQSTADKLCKDFEAHPPLPKGQYIQVLAVKIPRKSKQYIVIQAA